MADLTPLNVADSLEFSEPFLCTYSSNFNSEDIAWHSSLQSLLTNLNVYIAKYFSVICLLYLFNSLFYQTLYHFKLREMK